MGTRNLIAVHMGGEYKIAQYGQWDGYPEGQGKDIIDFLAGEGNIERLKSALVRCRYMEPEGRDKDFLDEYEKNAPEWSSQPDNRTPEQKRWFATYISRDLGAEILDNVASSDNAEIVLKDSISFAADSLMCEWAYVIDFDVNTLEVFKGFNKIPLGDEERFKDAIADDDASKEYLPVCLAAKYDLSCLPTIEQMIADCCPDDEDD